MTYDLFRCSFAAIEPLNPAQTAGLQTGGMTVDFFHREMERLWTAHFRQSRCHVGGIVAVISSVFKTGILSQKGQGHYTCGAVPLFFQQ